MNAEPELGFEEQDTGYAPEIIQFPKEVSDAWGWIMAFDAWDYGDPEKLTTLIMSDEPMPNELKPALAKRLNGEKKPKKKSDALRKIPAGDRMLIAMHFSTAMWFSKANETIGLAPNDKDQKYIDWLADKERREKIDVKRDMQRFRRVAAEKVAHRFGISTETLENIVRDIRKKARDYPDV